MRFSYNPQRSKLRASACVRSLKRYGVAGRARTRKKIRNTCAAARFAIAIRPTRGEIRLLYDGSRQKILLLLLLRLSFIHF